MPRLYTAAAAPSRSSWQRHIRHIVRWYRPRQCCSVISRRASPKCPRQIFNRSAARLLSDWREILYKADLNTLSRSIIESASVYARVRVSFEVGLRIEWEPNHWKALSATSWLQNNCILWFPSRRCSIRSWENELFGNFHGLHRRGAFQKL